MVAIIIYEMDDYSSTRRCYDSIEDLHRDSNRSSRMANTMKLQDIQFDGPTVSSWQQFFQKDDRIWNLIQLNHCTGHVDGLIRLFHDKTIRFSSLQSLRTTADIDALAIYLRDDTKLQVLSIDWATYTEEEAICFARALQHCQHMHTLHVSRWTIQDRNAMTAIGMGLAQNKSLQNFRIMACDFPDGSFMTWISAMTKHPTLTNLGIERCFMGKVDLDALATLLESSPLTTTSLSSSASSSSLSSSSSSSSKLQSLSLQWNKTRGVRVSEQFPRQFQAPISSLQVNTTLIQLDLNGNFLGDDDLAELANVLRCNSTLQSLSIASNQLTNPIPILQVLQKNENTTLSNLDVSNNILTDETMEDVAQCLSTASGLKRINLQGNPITVVGEMAILRAVISNSELESVVLHKSSTGVWHQVDYWTSLNRGGRRLFRFRGYSLSALWPLVMERANTIRYYTAGDKWKEPTDESMQATVIFSLLHGPVLLERKGLKSP